MNWRKVDDHRYEKVWVFGEPDCGCGVYETEAGWEANVVIYNEIYGLPTRPTKEEAMTEAENRFGKLYEQYHEVVN